MKDIEGYLPIRLAQLSKENEFSITLVSLDEQYRKQNLFLRHIKRG